MSEVLTTALSAESVNCAKAKMYSSGVWASLSLTAASALRRGVVGLNSPVLNEHLSWKTYLDRISLSPRTRLDRIWVSSLVISGGISIEVDMMKAI